MDLLSVDDRGLFCAAGGFHIDPRRPVDLAVITHAHADHARAGSRGYVCSEASAPILRRRLRGKLDIRALPYGERIRLGQATVSLHPSGHVLGAAQVRVEHAGEVWVATGDFKRAADPTCRPFEVVPCDVLITEATFALPIYRWPSGQQVAREILSWWESAPEVASLLFCYAFGKTQRVLAELNRLTDRPVFLHGAAVALTNLYRRAGIAMVPTHRVSERPKGSSFAGELIIAPPSAHRSRWMRRFKAPQTAFASGWMHVRGQPRRQGFERGFVLSDHADWDALVQTVRETGAHRVLLTHGDAGPLARYLNELGGVEACALEQADQAEDE
jgi:putative mRNA 3-end processing factor